MQDLTTFSRLLHKASLLEAKQAEGKKKANYEPKARVGHIQDNPNHLQASGGNKNNRGNGNQQNAHTQNAYYAPPMLGNNPNSYYASPTITTSPKLRTMRLPTTVTPPTTTLPQSTPEQAITRRTTHTCEKHDRSTLSAGDVADEDIYAEFVRISLPNQRQNLSLCFNPGGIHPLQITKKRAGRLGRLCHKAGHKS